MTLFKILLVLHIGAGITALLAAVVATISKTANASHEWHIYSGRIFFRSMCIVSATAVPMTFIHPNIFLFLIALFSFYLAVTGWRYARNRKGIPARLDWGIAGGMGVVSLAMICFGLFLLINGNGGGIAMSIFGGIGAALSLLDLKRFRAGGLKGANRIAAHLTSMLAAGIAALTAFVVTNVSVEPVFLLWLAPTVIVTPIIVLWNGKVLSGKRLRGMPE